MSATLDEKIPGDRYATRSGNVALAGIAIFLLWVGGQVTVGDPVVPTDTIAPTVYNTLETVDPSPVMPAPVGGSTQVASDTTAPVPPPAPLVVSDASPAVRGSAVQATDTLPPPPTIPTGLNGQPFAPVGLDGCAEMEWYREQAGLPAEFDRIGYLESRCMNDVNTWCCYGYFQIYAGLHIGAGSFDECGVDEISDMFGGSAVVKQRNVCMAVRVFRQQGRCAWDVVRC